MIPRQLGPMMRMPSKRRCSDPDRLLERAPLGADLPETGRDDDDAEDSGLAALADDPRHLGRGGADHRQVGSAREARHVGVGMDAEDRLHRRVDRIDDAAEAGADQVAKDRAADALRVLVGAEEGDALRLEDRIELVDVHLTPPPCGLPGSYQTDRPGARRV